MRTPRRLVLPLALVALLAFYAGPAEGRTVIKSWCSESGDVCTAVTKKGGKLKLEMATFSFRGEYRLCVRNPSGVKRCRSFKLRGPDKFSLYSDRVGFAGNFPSNKPGKYKATWYKSGGRIGPGLKFKP